MSHRRSISSDMHRLLARDLLLSVQLTPWPALAPAAAVAVHVCVLFNGQYQSLYMSCLISVAFNTTTAASQAPSWILPLAPAGYGGPGVINPYSNVNPLNPMAAQMQVCYVASTHMVVPAES